MKLYSNIYLRKCGMCTSWSVDSGAPFYMFDPYYCKPCASELKAEGREIRR